MAERKWSPTVGEMIDRLTILELKHLHNPSQRESIRKEIEDLVDDLNVALPKPNYGIYAEFIRHVIILAQYNTHIWENEKNARSGEKDGNKLYFTHECNGVRTRAKDKINKRLNNRIDPKVDAVASDIPDFEPLW